MAPIGIGKLLMFAGGLMFVVGLLLAVGNRFGLGQLPGDISYRRGNTGFYFPVVTSILLSIGLTVLLNILLRFWK